MWLRWAQWELVSQGEEWLETVLSEGLKQVPWCASLWRLYLEHLRKQHPPLGRTEASTALLLKAHELALQQAGQAVDAAPLHRLLIQLWTETPAPTAPELQHQTDQLRRIYQRALSLPLLGLEQLWQEYDRWEQSLNRAVGKRLTSERSQAYMTARSHVQELLRISQLDLLHLGPLLLARSPPGTAAPLAYFRFALPPHANDPQRAAQGLAWVDWELRNPLGLPDAAQVNARVTYAFRQLASHLAFYPEFWYRWARHWQGLSRPGEAENCLRQGLRHTPGSPLLCCLLAEQIMGDEQRRPDLEDRQEAARTVFEEAITADDNTISGADLTLLYIQWMQQARRNESMAAARLVFSRARKDERQLGYQLYVAAAKMEWFGRKEAVVAGKIFELGMAKHGTQLDYLLEYLDFLIHQNDDQSKPLTLKRL